MTGFGMNTQNYGAAWQGIPYQMPMNTGFNYNCNWSSNATPLFNYNNGYNFMSVFYDASSSLSASSSSKKKKGLTFVEKQKLYAEKAEEIKQYQEAIKANNAKIAEVKAMKDADGNVPMPKEDGTIETLEDRKKQPWYKRAWNAVKNMGNGVFKMGTDFLGFENGKFNLKKCLKNVGIAALAVGACCLPVVGGAIATTMLVAGVTVGAVKTGIGIHKAVNAKTVVERDRAFEDIGAGAFTAISSAVGLKAKGASFRLSQTSSTAPAASTTPSVVVKLVATQADCSSSHIDLTSTIYCVEGVNPVRILLVELITSTSPPFTFNS